MESGHWELHPQEDIARTLGPCEVLGAQRASKQRGELVRVNEHSTLWESGLSRCVFTIWQTHYELKGTPQVRVRV